MDKAKKNELTAQIKEMMDNSAAVYFTNFAGMTVFQVNEMRDEFFKAGIKYKVVKNTLALKAIGESSSYSGFINDIAGFLKGNTGIVFSGGDPVAPAKILKKLSDKSDKPKFKVAVVDNMFFGEGKLNELASLLNKEELISGILVCLNSPVSGIVGAINAVMRDLASVIEEAAKKKAA
ncbi:MAG: 50S ribosomal protein L10 [Ignavibacteriae bacterium]|jgi:large subunit ribosomal protein L10|nr:50S ribosomal protein L10 [Ignavibacteriota bacterium]